MKGYKKLMDFVALVEKAVLAATMILILVLTVGNVFSRKVIHQSWSFTEELVVAIFVLITLLGAALSAREGGLVGLNLVTERLPKSCKKPVIILITLFSVAFMGILCYYGMDKVLAQLANQKRTGRNGSSGPSSLLVPCAWSCTLLSIVWMNVQKQTQQKRMI